MIATTSFIKRTAKKCPYFIKVPTKKGWRVVIVWAFINNWAVDFNFVSKKDLTEKEADKMIKKLEASK